MSSALVDPVLGTRAHDDERQREHQAREATEPAYSTRAERSALRPTTYAGVITCPGSTASVWSSASSPQLADLRGRALTCPRAGSCWPGSWSAFGLSTRSARALRWLVIWPSMRSRLRPATFSNRAFR